ncbi:MAG: M28 family peptidase [Acidobacteriota bacterium]|nr:M28 family peptidase [Acidobacteriota bacterium]
MNKVKTLLVVILLAAGILPAQFGRSVPPTFLSRIVLADIVNEASGDMALQNEIFLSGVNRNRKAEEYANGYFETAFLVEKLKEYGVSEARVIDLPTTQPKLWDAVSAELWITKPALRKIANLDEVPACLCSGSADAEITAELVYVGPGSKESYYEGKDVKGKIVLVSGYAGGAQALAVEKLGAAGIIAYSSSHPEFDPDQVGWGGLSSGEKMKPTFGFMVSTRQGQELRDQLERGAKIEVRAMVKAQMVPYKEQMVEALIKGTDLVAEELVFTAHLYEGYAKQGANDDVSGCVSLLETARVLQKLVAEGKIPPLRRSVRFLFVPEIEGTIAYLKKFPEIGKRFFADINEDMVGESLARNRSFFSCVQTPWSLPTWLNDVMSVYLDWMSETQRYDGAGTLWPVWSPTGTRDPFPAVMDAHSGGSDHIVFVDGGVRVPAVMFICWPDMWYHSSGDTPDKSDSTQLKRVVVLSAASAVTLAGAGPVEAEKIIAVVGGGALARLGQDKIRAESLLRDAAPAEIHAAYKEARNVLAQGFLREAETLESTRFFVKSDARLGQLLQSQKVLLEACRAPFAKAVDEAYQSRCRTSGLKPQAVAATAEETRLAKIVPVRTAKMTGPLDLMEFYTLIQAEEARPIVRQVRGVEGEIRNFVDGRKSVLQIRDAVAAEAAFMGVPVPTLADIESYLKFLEKSGYLKIAPAR